MWSSMCVSPKLVLNPAIRKMVDEKKLDMKSIKKIPPHSMVVMCHLPDGRLKLGRENNVYQTGINHGMQLYMSVDCGRCHECIKKRVNQLVARLSVEMENHKQFGSFITLTYADEHLPINEVVNTQTGEISYIQSVRKEDVQKFLKRLRMRLERKGLDISELKYFYVAEYGMKDTQNMRPHYHIILFYDNMPFNELYDEVAKAWTLGFVTFKPLVLGRMKYCAMSHCTANKLFPNPAGSDKPFSHWSQGLGIPKNKELKDYIRKNGKVKVETMDYSADRYLQDKLYTKSERRKRTNHRLQSGEIESEEVKRYKAVVNRLFPKKQIEDLTFKEVLRVNAQLRSDENMNYKEFYKKFVLKKR